MFADILHLQHIYTFLFFFSSSLPSDYAALFLENQLNSRPFTHFFPCWDQSSDLKVCESKRRDYGGFAAQQLFLCVHRGSAATPRGRRPTWDLLDWTWSNCGVGLQLIQSLSFIREFNHWSDRHPVTFPPSWRFVCCCSAPSQPHPPRLRELAFSKDMQSTFPLTQQRGLQHSAHVWRSPGAANSDSQQTPPPPRPACTTTSPPSLPRPSCLTQNAYRRMLVPPGGRNMVPLFYSKPLFIQEHEDKCSDGDRSLHFKLSQDSALGSWNEEERCWLNWPKVQDWTPTSIPVLMGGLLLKEVLTAFLENKNRLFKCL